VSANASGLCFSTSGGRRSTFPRTDRRSPWYHLVLTRNVGAVYRLFVNGALAVTLDSLTGTDLFNIPAGSVDFAIGSIAGKRSFQGHMHGARVTHGVDRYFDTDGFIGDWPENVDQFPAYAAVAA
jgi:hypothetical protein